MLISTLHDGLIPPTVVTQRTRTHTHTVRCILTLSVYRYSPPGADEALLNKYPVFTLFSLCFARRAAVVSAADV